MCKRLVKEDADNGDDVGLAPLTPLSPFMMFTIVNDHAVLPAPEF